MTDHRRWTEHTPAPIEDLLKKLHEDFPRWSIWPDQDGWTAADRDNITVAQYEDGCQARVFAKTLAGLREVLLEQDRLRGRP